MTSYEAALKQLKQQFKAHNIPDALLKKFEEQAKRIRENKPKRNEFHARIQKSFDKYSNDNQRITTKEGLVKVLEDLGLDPNYARGPGEEAIVTGLWRRAGQDRQ